MAEATLLIKTDDSDLAHRVAAEHGITNIRYHRYLKDSHSVVLYASVPTCSFAQVVEWYLEDMDSKPGELPEGSLLHYSWTQ